jgi:trans-aconitate methyltransferase
VTAQDEQVAAFETAGADYAELASRLRDPLRQILAGYAAPRRCDRVLDACCGTGASALPAARAVGPSGRVDAVDLAPSLLERGQAAATGLPQLRFIHPDVSTWRSPARPYDLVQSGYGVFFLPDMGAGARHLVSPLRPGGRFAVQTWRQGALASFDGCLFDTVAAAAGVFAQVYVRKMQATQLPNPEATVSEPSDNKAISRLRQRRNKPSPGAFRWHLRMAAADSPWCQRVRWHVGDDVP